MKEDRRAYEPPTVKVYQFDDNDLILTASGETTDPINPTADYAANALNQLFRGTNTTMER